MVPPLLKAPQNIYEAPRINRSPKENGSRPRDPPGGGGAKSNQRYGSEQLGLGEAVAATSWATKHLMFFVLGL